MRHVAHEGAEEGERSRIAVFAALVHSYLVIDTAEGLTKITKDVKNKG